MTVFPSLKASTTENLRLGLQEKDNETPVTIFLWFWIGGLVFRRMVIFKIVVSVAYKQLQPWQPRLEQQ